MSVELLSLIMDGFILFFLALTAFFAVRLSVHLKVFRDSKKDFQGLMVDLGRNVAKAESAIKGLQDASKVSGQDLETLIKEAQALRDELQIMTQASESMAGRLEKDADRRMQKKPALAPKPVRDPIRRPKKLRDKEERSFDRSPLEEDKGDAGRDPFSIRDRDPEFDPKGLENFLYGLDQDDSSIDIKQENSGNLPGDMSRAEKDLYDALSNIRNKRATVRTR